MKSTTTCYDPPRKVILELNRQLSNWRLLLPLDLQWSDNLRHELFHPAQLSEHDIAGPSPDLGIMIMQLRARFYSARFTLFSPFLYLALHHPELLLEDDIQLCVLALDSTLLWPLSAESVSNRKRIISHHFTWTQNAMSFLCIFVMIGKNRKLKDICEHHLDMRELRISVAVQLSWLQDLRAIDGIADWAWRLMHSLFIQEIEC